MSLDLTTLRLLKHRARYDRLAGAVPRKALDVKTGIVLADIGKFFREFPEASIVDATGFNILFKQAHPTLKDEDYTFYENLMRDVLSTDVPPEIESGLMKRLTEAATAVDVASVIERYQLGEDVDLRQHLTSLIDAYDKQVDRKVKNPQVLDAIEDLLLAEQNDEGLHFRLPCLNRHIKPLVPGDFVIMAARPDKGKTSWCASELTHMAAQVDTLFPDQNRSILWFNNEGPGKRIVTRTFQAALNATTEDLIKLASQPSENPKWKTKVREDYVKAIGGRPGVLRIMDIHDMWNYEVEDIMRMYRPALVLFDMIDNIRFGGELMNGGTRTDQVLEGMYQWARLMGVRHDCAVIANSQISADGDGLQWPTLPMLKDSKTGKQGAADLIITMGAVNDPQLAGSRYFGTTKNKKVRTGMPSSPMQEVVFDGNRSRFVEMQG